jgi:hypothetical protein
MFVELKTGTDGELDGVAGRDPIAISVPGSLSTIDELKLGT